MSLALLENANGTRPALPLPRAPRVATPSVEGTPASAAIAPVYFEEQHHTWRSLCHVQGPAIAANACSEYLAALEQVVIDEDRIPELATLDRMMRARTGWELIRVDGYIPPRWFFQLLAQRRFPCMDQLRNARELLYTSEPDMFHDVMGHLPVLANPTIGEYYQLFGRAGVRARFEEQTTFLDKIYWYSMEFGILNPRSATGSLAGCAGSGADGGGARVYGAGLITAPTEIFTSLSDAVTRRPFSIDAVIAMEVDIRRPNDVLFEVGSMAELASQFVDWAKQERLL